MPKPGSTGTATRYKSAESIYKGQNKALHKAMSNLAGKPYTANKDEWCGIFSELLDRQVEGLSGLTLGERDLIIKHFQGLYSRKVLHNPAVPKRLADWKTGDAPDGYEQRRETDRQVKFIFALWANLGYEPAAIRAMIKARYGVEDVRFLDNDQKAACIGYLKHRCRQSGKPVKYYE